MSLFRLTDSDFQPINLQSWLSEKSGELQPIAAQWMNEIANRGGDVQQVFHDNCPTYCVFNVPFAYVNVFAKHINVGFFYGAHLHDPAHILLGTGKNMRHVKVGGDSNPHEAALRKLIQAAYDDLKVRLLSY